MSDSEPGASLGKRQREEENGSSSGGVPDMPPADVDDSSDEEIGPMPGPATDEVIVHTNGRKKKRAGGCDERLYM